MELAAVQFEDLPKSAMFKRRDSEDNRWYEKRTNTFGIHKQPTEYGDLSLIWHPKDYVVIDIANAKTYGFDV